jgi:hypothetical protein
MTTVKTKAKRKISKFNFEAEGSAVALVSASQGGAANSLEYLSADLITNVLKEFAAPPIEIILEQL